MSPRQVRGMVRRARSVFVACLVTRDDVEYWQVTKSEALFRLGELHADADVGARMDGDDLYLDAPR